MTTYVTETKGIIKEFYELYTNKLDNRDEIDRYLERQTTKTDLRNRKAE